MIEEAPQQHPLERFYESDNVPAQKAPSSESSKKSKSEIVAHPPSSESKLGRFFQKINLLFKPEDTAHRKLSGRIHELQKDTEEVLEQLIEAKQLLESETDPMYTSFVTIIIEPMIKELMRFQNAKEELSTAQKVKSIHRYNDLLDKAKEWVELCSNDYEPDSIYQAMMNHHIQDFRARIDRDCQVIRDYLNHTIEDLAFNEYLKNEFMEKIESKLDRHFFELKRLQECPSNLTLETLSQWRADADLARETHFSAALHTIDDFTKILSPTHKNKEEGDAGIEILIDLKLLEEKVASLTHQLHAASDADKIIYATLLAELEDEAHRINRDLRLSHDHVERLQKLIQILAIFRKEQ